jgi:WD40 repeat protein
MRIYSQDHTIKMWDIETGKCFQTLRGHTDKVWCVRFDEQKIVRWWTFLSPAILVLITSFLLG